MDARLDRLLREAGLDPAAIGDPEAAFRALDARHGRVITVEDRYALEARALGVAIDELPPDRRDELARAVTQLRFPGWEILGEYRNDPVEVVPYDPAWPERYETWRSRLRDALGAVGSRIEHVGSTAVPGLAAKPIIDVQISVSDVTDEAAYVEAITACGVPLRSRDEMHRYFRPAPGTPRDVHIHVCTTGSDWERDHLVFRDYLRHHDRVRDEYAALKHHLAARFPDDRLAYTDGKSEFILGVLEAAHAWAAGRGDAGTSATAPR